MNISISIKKEQLDNIIYALQNERIGFDITTQVDRVYYYLFNNMFKKLLKKQIDKSDDYSNKPFAMKFDYPSAASLYAELLKVRSGNEYRYNCCRIFIMDLRKKLD